MSAELLHRYDVADGGIGEVCGFQVQPKFCEQYPLSRIDALEVEGVLATHGIWRERERERGGGEERERERERGGGRRERERERGGGGSISCCMISDMLYMSSCQSYENSKRKPAQTAAWVSSVR